MTLVQSALGGCTDFDGSLFHAYSATANSEYLWYRYQDWKSNYLMSKEISKYLSNGTYEPLHFEEYHYKRIQKAENRGLYTSTQMFFPNGQSYNHPDLSGYAGPAELWVKLKNSSVFIFGDYYVTSGIEQLDSLSTTEYLSDGNLSNVKRYSYNSFGQLDSESTENSAGLVKSTTYRYPKDYLVGDMYSSVDAIRNASSGVDDETKAHMQLIYNNMVSQPIEIIKKINGKIATAQLVTYKRGAGNTVYPRNSYTLETTSLLDEDQSENALKFNESNIYENPADQYTFKKDNHYPSIPNGTFDFDDNGNLVQQSKNQNTHSSLIWSDTNIHPIAWVINAKSTEVYHTSFEEDGNISTTAYTGDYIKSLSSAYSITKTIDAGEYLLIYQWRQNSSSEWQLQVETVTHSTGSITTDKTSGEIDELRLHPKDAQMTTYTYDLLIGVKSVTDPNNQTTYYEYDDFGRLEKVRDSKGNLVQEMEYNYVNN